MASKKKETEDTSNARRFIDAYNKIDHSLRAQYNLKRGQTYSDVIRRCSSLNSIVRKFEDALIDYGRLRNAIIHKGDDNLIIAEPHLSAVEHFEKLCELICTPPFAINSVGRNNVLTVANDVSLKDVIALMSKTGFSNIPVYNENTLTGVANGQKIMNFIGEKINRKANIDKVLAETKIDEVVHPSASEMYYTLAGEKLTIEEALNMFYNNRKLLVIIITKTGDYAEPALGIISVTDIIDLNAILDTFN